MYPLDCNYFPGKKLLNRKPYDGQLNHRPELQQMPKSNNYLGFTRGNQNGMRRVLLTFFFFCLVLGLELGMGATSPGSIPFVFVGVNLLFKPHYLCGCSAITRLQKRHDLQSFLQPATCNLQQTSTSSSSSSKEKSKSSRNRKSKSNSSSRSSRLHYF